MLYAICCMLYAICYMLYAMCYMLYAMGQREADAEPQPGAAIDEETPHEEPIQHEQNDSDASQLAGTTSIEEFDLVSSIARYYKAAMEYEVDVWDHD